ncbi:hypothetical protein FB45DRAFT_927943 [Roridomyces roridus]|uniref:Uncharacterized protein n=1 Tax=Roridomyces roridus TaxID=1738132 RepID=A0AAD7BH66_9AGAR|nr:hypothetical protein FB45DRAFT_927943 [Roridomyces roridus]
MNRLAALFNNGSVTTFLQSSESSYPVPTVERTHKIDIEGDVERALHLYLVNPVNLIFEDYLRRPSVRPGQSLTCKCQVTQEKGMPWSRVDMLWYVANKVILAMEVKRNDAIRPYEWNDALPPNSAGLTLQQQVQQLQQVVNLEKQQGDFVSLIFGKAEKIMRQVTKYFTAFKPPNILIFDWNNMILLDIKSAPSSGDFPHMSQTDGSGYWTFRRMLLAALIDGLNRA